MRHVALLVALSMGGASCFSGGDEHASTHSQRIIGGTRDTTHASVVAITRKSSTTICSGSLIAPTTVLTAAHCVHGVATDDLAVVVGTDITAPERTVAVTSAVAYPTFAIESSGVPGGVDLGVITLAEPLDLTPIPVRTDVSDDTLASATVTIVGYGINDTTDSSGAGVRRSVAVPVRTVCSRVFTLGTSDANECYGDSGGAVLLDGQLVGVISGGKPDCASPAIQQRLSAHTLWLASPASVCAACVSPDPSCDAPIEGATSDAGVDATSDTTPDLHDIQARGGGCVVGRSSHTGWIFGLLCATAMLRERRRVARRSNVARSHR